MQKTILTIVITAIIVGSGTYYFQNQNSTVAPTKELPTTQKEVEIKEAQEIEVKEVMQKEEKKEPLKTIHPDLKADQYLEITKKPNFPLPEGIHEAQIGQYFILGDTFFALVRRPSMNLNLGLPNDFEWNFTGVLAANTKGGKWEKILTIKDKEIKNKNNPYWLWVERDSLFLTIVDQNGAGSGEGIMKVMSTSDLENWNQGACYYFEGPPDGKDYFKFSAVSEGRTHEAYSGKECSNYSLITQEIPQIIKSAEEKEGTSTALNYPTLEEYNDAIDYSCNQDSDCEIKDIGNCCGAYPKCVNKNSIADSDFVKKACAKEGLASGCGYPSVDTCKCSNNKCEGFLKN